MGNPSLSFFFSFFLFFFFFSMPSFPFLVAGQDRKTGGYTKIANVSDQHIVEIAEFAVAEYNKATTGDLIFLRVVSGRQQVVAGMNYDLVIEAADSGRAQLYEAVVCERAWENYRRLASFEPE